MVHVLHFCFHSSSPGCLRPRFRFPLGVQRIAALVMELASLRSMCPIQRHRFLVTMVSISSFWHRAKRSRLEMVLGQKMRWIFHISAVPSIMVKQTGYCMVTVKGCVEICHVSILAISQKQKLCIFVTNARRNFDERCNIYVAKKNPD